MSAAGAPAGRIDAHCHVWQLSRGDYGWLDGTDAALAPIRRDVELADHDPLCAAADIDGRVLVQAAPTVHETRYLLSLAAADPATLGVVGWVDLADAGCVATLEALCEDPKFLGVRPMLQDLAETDWIATRPVREALDALGRLRLRFDALVDTRHLQALLAFVDRMPELPLVIDHAAKPALGKTALGETVLGGTVLDPAWTGEMARLAEAENVHVKLSGLLTEMPADRRRSPEEAAANLRPVVDHLLATFGPRRMIWGSDWPVLTLAAPFAFWTETTGILLGTLSEAEQADIRGGNARRFYGAEGRAA
jgi:L-fuconolactonase